MTGHRHSLLHNPDFMRLSTAETISQFGSQVSALAIPLIAAAIGLIFALGAIGFLAGAPVADRLAARIGVGPTIVLSSSIGWPAILLLALAPAGLETPFFVAAGICGGLSASIYNINR